MLLHFTALLHTSRWPGSLHIVLSCKLQDVRLTAGVRAPLTQQVGVGTVICYRLLPPSYDIIYTLACWADSCVVHQPPFCLSAAQGVGAAQPYLRVQENCWSLTVTPDGQWRVSYDL